MALIFSLAYETDAMDGQANKQWVKSWLTNQWTVGLKAFTPDEQAVILENVRPLFFPNLLTT